MTEWKEGILSEISDITMGQSPKGESCNNIGNGEPLLNGPTEFGLKYPDPVQFTTEPTKNCKEGDILFCVRGSTTGRMNWANKEYVIGRGLAAFRHKKGLGYQYFLKGLIDYKLDFLLASATGSTFPNVSRELLENMEIHLPPLPEQRAIAGVLSSLDDKIDLLHRQNKTLEAMAEALFRQWFVEEADAGWERRPLSGIATFLNGLACQKFPPENKIEKLPVLKIRELSGGISGDSDWATSKIENQYIVHSGDVIFSWSASLIVKMWDGVPCILNQHLFKVTSNEYPKWFYFNWCRFHLAEFISISSSHATTMGHIKRGDLDNAMVVIPPLVQIEQMNLVMEPLLNHNISNSAQIKSLEALRDTLLPKLMSGEVRVAI